MFIVFLPTIKYLQVREEKGANFSNIWTKEINYDEGKNPYAAHGFFNKCQV